MNKDKFKIQINRRDIVEISDFSKQLRITDQEFLRTADYDSVHTAYILLSLHEFLTKRRCAPDFEVNLAE